VAWRLTTRADGRVERQTFADGALALAALEERARGIAGGSRRDTIKVAKRTYDPVVQVQARLEVRGPRGAAGGVDVRGNGSVEAYTGRFRRQLVAEERGESAYAALRRALGSSVIDAP
jgi:hypothetical protein